MDDTKREWVRSWLIKARSDLRSARALVDLAEQVKQGQGTSHPNIGQIEQLRRRDPEVYFAVTVLWKILASWVYDLEDY